MSRTSKPFAAAHAPLAAERPLALSTPAPLDRKEALTAPFLCCVLAFAFFLYGFLSGEYVASFKFDFILYHFPSMQLFAQKPFLVALRDLNHAAGPLMDIVMSPVTNHGPWAVRAVHFLFALATLAMMYVVLRWRVSRAHLDNGLVWLALTALMLSPYFRGAAFWANTDLFPVFLTVAAFLLIEEMAAYRRPSAQFLLGLGGAICALSSVYTRQFFFFVPAMALFRTIQLSEGKWTASAVSLAYAALAVPGLLLLQFWHGLNAPKWQGEHFEISGSRPHYLFTFITFYAVPFLAWKLIEAAREMRQGGSRFIRVLLGENPWPPLLAAIAIFAIYLGLFGFEFVKSTDIPSAYGGGVVGKISLMLYSRFGWPGMVPLLGASLIGIYLTLRMIMAREYTFLAVLLAMLVATIISTKIYQKYFEFMIVFGFLLTAQDGLFRTVMRRPVLVIYCLFNCLLLAVSIWYYVHVVGL